MALSETQKNFVEKFKKEINSRSAEIDTEGEEDWFSLTLGWAIGKGMSPEDARNFAHYIRYETDLG